MFLHIDFCYLFDIPNNVNISLKFVDLECPCEVTWVLRLFGTALHRLINLLVSWLISENFGSLIHQSLWLVFIHCTFIHDLL